MDNFMRRFFQIALCVLLCGCWARADVIVLKSGRRVTARNVFEETLLPMN